MQAGDGIGPAWRGMGLGKKRRPQYFAGALLEESTARSRVESPCVEIRPRGQSPGCRAQRSAASEPPSRGQGWGAMSRRSPLPPGHQGAGAGARGAAAAGRWRRQRRRRPSRSVSPAAAADCRGRGPGVLPVGPAWGWPAGAGLRGAGRAGRAGREALSAAGDAGGGRASPRAGAPGLGRRGEPGSRPGLAIPRLG